MSSARRLALTGLLGLVAVMPLAGHAQQVFRIVGPDGKVTFSDRAPADPASKATAANSGTLPGSGPALPFELRAVANRYPVMLYTGPDCSPCASARSFLSARGIPHSERTVNTEDDVEALKRMTGAPRVPLVTIGSQQIRGFSEPEWSQFLNAAGYPKISQLPAGYKNPEAAPLVAAKPAEPAQRPAAQATAPANPTAPTEPTPPNPANIRF